MLNNFFKKMNPAYISKRIRRRIKYRRHLKIELVILNIIYKYNFWIPLLLFTPPSVMFYRYYKRKYTKEKDFMIDF